MKKLLALSMICMSSVAFASGNGGSEHSGGGDSTVFNYQSSAWNNQQTTVVNPLNQHQTQGQNQGQDQFQGQSQNVNDSGNSSSSSGASAGSASDQGQSQSANNAGNAQNVNFQTNVPRQHHNTPSAALFVPMPTATCQQTIGAAGMMPGVGFSVSGSYTNDNCEQLELAKALASINQLDASLEIMCGSKHGSKARLCREINAENNAEVVRTASAVSVINKSVPVAAGNDVPQTGYVAAQAGKPEYKWTDGGFKLVYN